MVFDHSTLADDAESLHVETPFRVPSSLDKEVYPLRWRHAPEEEPPDISGLPSIDDALYQFNTVKHHLDQHYRFFDEESFTRRHTDRNSNVSQSQSWPTCGRGMKDS